MAEPLTRAEADAAPDGPLASAAQRLERALLRLEATLAGATPAPAAPDRSEALVVELDAARRRQRELAEAASSASAALGRAMDEVRRTLNEDAERQGMLDLAIPDRSGPAGDEDEDDAAAPPPREEEPAA